MPVSQMRERVRLFKAPTVPVLDEGVARDVYTFVDSGEVDGAYPMSRGQPNSRSLLVAEQRAQRVDAVFCCLDDVPLEDGGKYLLRDLADERLYAVASFERSPRAGEFLISAEHTDRSRFVVEGEP